MTVLTAASRCVRDFGVTAALDLDLRPAMVFRRACKADQRSPDRIPLCPRGSADVTVTTGRERHVVSVGTC